MRTEEITAKAKKHAVKWNEFRLTVKHDFTRSELFEMAKEQNMPYYARMLTYLLSKKIHVTEVGVAYYYNTMPVMRYRFNTTPIHYSVLSEVIEAAWNVRATQIPKVANCIRKTEAEDGKLVSFSDADLVKELRKRGFEVIAKKTIEL